MLVLFVCCCGGLCFLIIACFLVSLVYCLWILFGVVDWCLRCACIARVFVLCGWIVWLVVLSVCLFARGLF